MRKSLLFKVAGIGLLLFGKAAFSGELSNGLNGDDALLRKVKALYGIQRKAITSVRYEFYRQLNGERLNGKFAGSRGSFYQATLTVSPQGWSSPNEVTWNGAFGYQRMAPNFLTRTMERKGIQIHCDPIESAVNISIGNALDIEPVVALPVQYVFKSATRSGAAGSEVIELTFEDQHGERLICRHAESVGYWPVQSKLVNRQGGVRSAMSRAEYVRVDDGGNTIYFPVEVETETYQDGGKVANTISMVVDRKTLEVNSPIPDKAFELSPWPSESMYDWKTGKVVHRPTDPKWNPVGQVAFPWDRVVKDMARFPRASGGGADRGAGDGGGADSKLGQGAISGGGVTSKFISAPVLSSVIATGLGLLTAGICFRAARSKRR